MTVQEEVRELPAERLEADIVGLARHLSAGTYELLVLVGELDACGRWAASGPGPTDGRWWDLRRDRPPGPRPTRAHGRVTPTTTRRRSRATAFLQHDHIHPYEQGGPTTIANLQRLCGPHNRAKERAESARAD